MPIGHFPICDGESGDLICINLQKENYGKIFYWYHEGSSFENLFLIANSFTEFILKLEIDNDNYPDEDLVDKMKVDVSPELLEMLKKSGFGPV